MVVEIMITAIVMVIQILSGPCQSVVQLKMDMFHGTQKHVAPHWLQHTVVVPREKNRGQLMQLNQVHHLNHPNQ
ncbi:hypothetical protein C0J52_15503 [Blattella germanica]|nr:hypothetical protein C0J52_15503 [Blattella germanica]